MFFLLGSPRSGTTLVAERLNAHPDISIPKETNFISTISMMCLRGSDTTHTRDAIVSFILGSSPGLSSLTEHMSENDIRECVFDSEFSAKSILDKIYLKIANNNGSKLSGDKSPGDMMSIHSMFSSGLLGNDSTVVHIVRDVRDQMASLRETGWADQDVLDTTFPRLWAANNVTLKIRMEKTNGKYLLVKYEELVKNPEEEFKKITDFLGVVHRREILDLKKNQDRYSNYPHQEKTYKDIDSSSIGSHSKKLNPDLIRSYTEQASEGLRVFGYL